MDLTNSAMAETSVAERIVSIVLGETLLVYYLIGLGRVLPAEIQQSFFR